MTRCNAKDRNLKVLVIEDTGFIRKIIRKSLTDLGVSTIVEVSDAGDAVRRLRTEKFDPVVSDSNLPTMTGFELLRYIRNNERIKDTPLLLLTANTDKDDGMAGLSSAISEYLAKPFSAEDLEKKLLSLMPKRDAFGPQDDSTM